MTEPMVAALQRRIDELEAERDELYARLSDVQARLGDFADAMDRTTRGLIAGVEKWREQYLPVGVGR